MTSDFFQKTYTAAKKYFLPTCAKARDILLRVFIGTTDIQKADPTKATIRLLVLVTAAIALFVLVCAAIGAPLGWCFRERRPMSLCSSFLLVIVGLISAEIYNIRLGKTPKAKLWHYLAIFFIYLACDDLLTLHEFYDHRICEIFGWDKHGPADHIDDGIVGLYGVFGVCLLLKFWEESKLFFKSKAFFILAALSAIATVIMDFIDGEDGIITLIQTTESEYAFLMAIMDIIEESFKIYAGVFFIGAFLNIVKYCRSKDTCYDGNSDQNVLAANGE